MEILVLILLILSWYGAGWTIVAIQSIISNETAKKVIDMIGSFATKSEKISPYIALLIFFGPLGFLLKKQLYGEDSSINKDL